MKWMREGLSRLPWWSNFEDLHQNTRQDGVSRRNLHLGWCSWWYSRPKEERKREEHKICEMLTLWFPRTLGGVWNTSLLILALRKSWRWERKLERIFARSLLDWGASAESDEPKERELRCFMMTLVDLRKGSISC